MDKQNSAIAESSTNQEEFTIVFAAIITIDECLICSVIASWSWALVLPVKGSV